MLPERKDILSVQWAPRVKRDERSEMEAALRTRGFAPNGFFTLSQKNVKPLPVPNKSDYFPIVYAEPSDQNREAIGLDVSNRPFNRYALRISALNHSQSATPAFSLVQNPEGPMAVALYFPVFYEHNPSHGNHRTYPPDDLKGYVILILLPEMLMTQNLDLSKFTLTDVTHGAEHRIFPKNRPLVESDTNVYSFPITIPERTWRLDIHFDSSVQIFITPYFILFAFLSLTFVVIAAMIYSFNHTAIISETNKQLELQKDELRKLAMTDSLTGLSNRLHFQEQAINASSSYSGTCALCLLDLDNFKMVNDKYGHQEGDRFLRDIAKTLKETLYKDAFAARFGGDEFVFIIPNLNDEDEIKGYLKQLLADIHIACGRFKKEGISVTASIGVSFNTNRNVDFDTLLNRADDAMYIAKRNGKNQFQFWQPEMKTNI